MTGETRASVSGWTIDTLAAHHAALRLMDERLRASEDRRYTEVGVEREKALKIKETADLAALGLAREIQTYKDEKANELREQINSERGLYASKNDLEAAVSKIEETLKPVQEFVSRQSGRILGTDNVWKYIFAVIAAFAAWQVIQPSMLGRSTQSALQIPPGYVLVPAQPVEPAKR